MRLLFFAVTLLVCSGCYIIEFEPYHEVVGVKDGHALVYIYRPSVNDNAMISPGVRINGKEFVLENRSYTYQFLKAGEPYKFELVLSNKYDGKSVLSLTPKEGQTYYVKLNTRNKYEDKKMTRLFSLTHENNVTGRQEAKNCRFFAEKYYRKFKKSWIADN